MIKNVKGYYDVFIPVFEKEDYIWEKIGEHNVDDEELVLDRMWDARKRNYVYNCHSNIYKKSKSGMRMVSK